MSRITTAIHGANIICEKSFVKSFGKFFNTQMLKYFTQESNNASAFDR